MFLAGGPRARVQEIQGAPPYKKARTPGNLVAGRRGGSASRSAAAFAPGHVTGFLRPQASARDPRSRGSTGGGVVLEVGVRATARWAPSAHRSVTVTGDTKRDLPISRDVAERLFGDRRGRLEVRLSHALPIGQGFGMSAAGALATALSVGELTGASPARRVEVAHLADLFGGGGLGGVAAILDGGWELRRAPGLPPRGRVQHRPDRTPVLVGVVGPPIPTPTLLRTRRFRARLDAAAAAAGADALRVPSPRALAEASERFTDALGLATPALHRLLGRLRHLGVPCAQAMFGNAFFATLPRRRHRTEAIELLEGAGLRAIEVLPASRGAHVVEAATHSGVGSARGT